MSPGVLELRALGVQQRLDEPTGSQELLPVVVLRFVLVSADAGVVL